MTDIIKTIGASGADYITIQAWWNARTGGAGDRYIGVLTDATDYTGITVNATYAGQLVLKADAAVKLDLANPTAPHARIVAAPTFSAMFFDSVAIDFRFEDLEIFNSSATTETVRMSQWANQAISGERVWIRGGLDGVNFIRVGSSTLTLNNFVISDAAQYGIRNNQPGVTLTNGVLARNNASNDQYSGGMRRDIAASVTNVVAVENLRFGFFGGSAVATMSYAASSDSTAAGANALTGVTTAAFTDYAANVFTAASGGVLDNTGPSGGDRGLVLAVAATLTVTSPVTWQLISRNKATNTGTIAITGTYANISPAAIEARWNGGEWSTIDSSVSGGTFSGSLTNLPSGNGSLEVRVVENTSVSDTIQNVAIGAKFLFWGQSNFSGQATNAQTYTGSAGWFHKYTVTNDAWQQGADPFDTATNQGSLFPLLSSQLITVTNCPVAFIGVASGSTTLAQWQAGQSLNDRMLSYIASAAADGLEGICSWIGESDASAATPEADYKSRYNSVINQLKTLTGVNSMLVAISGLDNANYTNVRQWINDIAASNANASDTVPQIWPLYQKIHYETNAEAALAAGEIFDGMSASFYPVVTGTFTTGILRKLVGGAVLANTALTYFRLYNPATGALVLNRTDLSTDANGRVTCVDAAITAGVDYKADWLAATGETRMSKKAAT